MTKKDKRKMLSKSGSKFRLIALLLTAVMLFTSIVFPINAVAVKRYDDTVSQSDKTTTTYYTGSYYDGLDTSNTGLAFRSDLAQLITQTHKSQPTYKALTEVWKTTDANEKGQVILFYSGTPVSTSYNYNREHVWPKDAGRAFPAESEAGSDAHHLRPCDSTLNSTRGSLSFDEVTGGKVASQNGSTSYGNLCYTGGGFFYPGVGYRGATARILMYVQVRWGDKFNLEFVDSAGHCKTIGKISTLMKWHLEEPPTPEEIKRNEKVFKIQGNRNPFIDHPEYAEMIFCNDGESYNAALKNVVETYGGYGQSKDIEGITFSSSGYTVTKGETVTIKPQLSPIGAGGALTWTTSNASVVTVSSGGAITGVNEGSATITVASGKTPSIKASTTVTVKGIKSIAITGTAKKTEYYVSEAFDPTGLTVTATYTDGSHGTINNSSCKWLNGTTEKTALTEGATSVICVYGDCRATYSGIKVNAFDSGRSYAELKAMVPNAGDVTATKYYTSGTITEIVNTTYGNLYIENGSGEKLYIYGLYSEDGKKRYNAMNPQPQVGDIIRVYGVMNNYNGTIEMKDAWTVQIISNSGGVEDGDDPIPVVTPVDYEKPIAGKAYYLVIDQATSNKKLFFAGDMIGFYYKTVTDKSQAVKVYVETFKDGYAIYFNQGTAKKYLDVVPRENKEGSVNVVLADTPTSVYKWDGDLSVFTTSVAGKTWYLGTFDSYDTVSASETNRISGSNASAVGTSQFIAYFLLANDSQGGDSQGGDSQGGDSQGGDSQGGDSQGGDSQGGDSQGGDSQGGDSQGGDSQGGDSQGEDSQGGDSQGEDSQGGDSQGEADETVKNFENKVAELETVNAQSGKLEIIKAAFEMYSVLSKEDKNKAAESYSALLGAVDTYNSISKTVNEAQNKVLLIAESIDEKGFFVFSAYNELLKQAN